MRLNMKDLNINTLVAPIYTIADARIIDQLAASGSINRHYLQEQFKRNRGPIIGGPGGTWAHLVGQARWQDGVEFFRANGKRVFRSATDLVAYVEENRIPETLTQEITKAEFQSHNTVLLKIRAFQGNIGNWTNPGLTKLIDELARIRESL